MNLDLPCGTLNESYSQDTSVFRTKLRWGLFFLFVLLLLAFPLYGGSNWTNFVVMNSITLISVLGLNLLVGYCGQISIGQSAFMAMGAYTSAILTSKFLVSFWIAMPLSGLVAGLAGIIFGAPSLRVKGFYLAVATLAAQFIIMWVIAHPAAALTGGPYGLAVPTITIGPWALETETSYFYLVVAVAFILTYVAKSLARSKIGRAFIAIRDNDLAAEVMGVNVFGYKIMAFFVGCFYAGIAGSLLAHYLAFINTENFQLMDSIWQLGIIIIGGMGSVMGGIFGTIFIGLLNEMVAINAPHLSEMFPQVGPVISSSLGLITFGLVIILFLIFEPRGINHRWNLFKAYYRLWPFAY